MKGNVFFASWQLVYVNIPEHNALKIGSSGKRLIGD
jgi:hypothetical protein